MRIDRAGLALSLVALTFVSSCSARPLVDEEETRRGYSESALAPHGGRALVADQLRDTTNLVGGVWSYRINPIPESCLTSLGKEGVYYEGSVRRDAGYRDPEYSAVADGVATYWNALGYQTSRAAYSPTVRIIIASDEFGATISYERIPGGLTIISKGPCTAADWSTQRRQDYEDVLKTEPASPEPLGDPSEEGSSNG